MHRILITNDDGIEAKGLFYLYEAVRSLGDVFVIAPAEEQSGASHSLTIRKPVRVDEIKKNWYKVYGTPADCVLFAHHEIMKREIDMVLSGINYAPNMGEDVIYSGTVAAAIEGRLLGYPSIAISALNIEKMDERFYDFLKRLVTAILKRRIKGLIPLLNINIPEGEVKGVKVTFLGKRIYKDIVEKKTDEEGRAKYILSGELSYVSAEGSDFNAVYGGYISVTPLSVNLTAVNEMEKWRKFIGSI